jgi:hypothetical protein
MRTTLLAAVVLSTLAAGAPAQVPAPTPAIDDLAWLAGCWVMPRADGGTMLGMNRTVRSGRTVEYEFLQILVVDGRLAYHARPSGQAPATFPLKSATADELVFEDPDHDFPQRIIYRQSADGSMGARVEGTMGGQTRGFDLAFRRCE